MREATKDPDRAFATAVNWARIEEIIRVAIRDACKHEGAPCWLCAEIAGNSSPSVRNVLVEQGVMEIGPVSDEYLNGTGPT